ncbi:hypothetical protein GCM10010211_33650 [Streptomyces albospinus]|uniref:Repressor Rok winged helix domain-containing protein n=2 Tax=Streptomyces albospinus TaxID=285515 RepID=A0ABQ2V2A1_9ACTN|nr:hypothetical protein GCM10010211_33650 [Streptomyces albospinus]
MTDSLLHQTIENLESTLPELEAQEKLLRGELNDVVQRVTSARHALEHLRVLTGAAAPVEQSAPLATVGADVAPPAPASVEPAGDSASQDSPEVDAAAAAAAAPEMVAEPGGVAAAAVPSPRTAASSSAKSRTAKKRTAKKAAAKKAAAPAKTKKAASKQAAPAEPAAKGTGGLLEAALKVLQKSSVPMRAREINEALGREETPGQIESVRNTLDRVAKQQKLVTRPGRGTYAAL